MKKTTMKKKVRDRHEPVVTIAVSLHCRCSAITGNDRFSTQT
jgi:hypothetical protein